ncbi:MAG: PAS domain-containing protein [Gemmatimonadota bacterium]
MLQAPSLLSVVLPALVVGVGVGVLVGRRRDRPQPAEPAETAEPAPRKQECEHMRAKALDAVAEPVIVVGSDGRVRDCNAAALVLLDRPRGAVLETDASALRTLLTSRALPQDWGELLAMRAPWIGDAHVRLPDGSRRASPVRLVPVFGANGALDAMVEVYRELASEPALPPDQYLRALDAGEAHAATAAERAEREVQLLSLAIADLERVVRQYELLLPAVQAEDPLAEAIAGLAAETSEVVASADVSRLLREVPGTLTRLREQLQLLAESPVPNGTRDQARRD